MSKTKNVPAYLALVFRIVSRAVELGMTVERDSGTKSTLPENNGHVFVRIDGGTASMIIPRHAGEVAWCDSHIDWAGQPGYIELEKPNGAVVCRVDPAEIDLDAYLKRLSGAKKRDKKAASKGASEATSELLAKLQSLGLPAQEPAASEPAPHANGVSEEQDLGDFSELA
jgi:hypothetical protein